MSWKKLVLGLAWGIVVLAWIGVIAGAGLGLSKAQGVIAVTVAAVITEIAFWVTAAILGVSVFESRKAIWRSIFGGGAADRDTGDSDGGR